MNSFTGYADFFQIDLIVQSTLLVNKETAKTKHLVVSVDKFKLI